MGLFGGGGSKKSKVRVAQYYLSQHLGVAKALDWVSGIYYREKPIWTGHASTNQTVTINNLELFGGAKREGGVQGFIDIMLGGASQVVTSAMASRIGRSLATMPGFRGVTSLFFYHDHDAEPTRGFSWQNNNAYLGPVWVKGTRAPKGLSPEIALIPRAAAEDLAYTYVTTVDIDAVANAGGDASDGLSVGITVSGFAPTDVLRLTMPSGETYTAWNYQVPVANRWLNEFDIIPDGSVADSFRVSESGISPSSGTHFPNGYASAALARAAFGEQFVTGASSYKFYILDTATGGGSGTFNNSGGVSVRIERATDHDANPAHMIYEAQTDPDGMGSPTTLFDQDTYEAAAATLYSERLGLSLIWSRQSSIESFVQEIIDHIEAVPRINPRTGLWELKLIRGDYDEGSLRELTPDNCVLTKFQRKAWADTINEIVPIYTTADTQEEVAAAPCQDLANIAMQGGIVSETRNYYGARSEGLARRLAFRDLRTASEPLASAEVEADRSFWDVMEGDCLKLTWPELGISTLVMRVLNVDRGKPGDSKIKIGMVEDVFAKPSNDFDEVNYDEWVDPDQPPSPIDFVRIFTLPYRLIELMTDLTVTDENVTDVAIGILAAEDSVTNSYDLLLELPDSLGDPVYENVGTKNLVGHATLIDPLDAEATSIVAAFADLISGNPVVGGLVFIGDAAEDEVEICLIDDFTGSPGSWVLRRGVLDTVPRAWDAGTVVWFTSLEAVIADETVLSSGQTINAKLLSNTALGQLAEADAPVETETLTDRPYLPIRPADVKVNGIGFGTVDASGIDPIPVTWANRNRLTEPTPFLAWDDATVSPEAGQTTTILVKDLLGVTLDTISGLSGTSYNVPASSFGSEPVGIIEVWSERDGLMSLQAHAITVIVSSANALELEDTGVLELEDTGMLELE